MNVLQNSPYQNKYIWSVQSAPSAVFDRTNGMTVLAFIKELLLDNNAPCVEEVVGLLEDFVQESKATNTSDLITELGVALNNAASEKLY